MIWPKSFKFPTKSFTWCNVVPWLMLQTDFSCSCDNRNLPAWIKNEIGRRWLEKDTLPGENVTSHLSRLCFRRFSYLKWRLQKTDTKESKIIFHGGLRQWSLAGLRSEPSPWFIKFELNFDFLLHSTLCERLCLSLLTLTWIINQKSFTKLKFCWSWAMSC